MPRVYKEVVIILELKITLSAKQNDMTVKFSTGLKEGDYPKNELIPHLVLRIRKWISELDREFDFELNQRKLDESLRSMVMREEGETE